MGNCIDCKKSINYEDFETELQHRIAWLYTVESIPSKAVVEIDRIEITKFNGNNAAERARIFAEQLRQLYISQGAVFPSTEQQHRIAWLYTVGSIPSKAVVEIDHIEIAKFNGNNATERSRIFAEQLRQLYVSQGAVIPSEVVSS